MNRNEGLHMKISTVPKTEKEDHFLKFNQISKTSNAIWSVIIVVFALICIIPVILIAMISISSEKSIELYGYKFWPVQFSFYAYQYIWESKGKFFTAFFVSIFITIVGTLVGLLLNTTMGYVLSRKSFRFRNFFTWAIFIPMLFNGGMISYYMVVASFLKLKDSLLALILPMAVSSFYIIILRTFFQTTVPDAIIESAKIDGASQLKIFARIVLPISLPAVATIGLFLTFAYWNDWYNALLFIDSSNLVPLQALLIRIQNDVKYLQEHGVLLGAASAEFVANLPTESVRMAIVMIIVVPIACSYPFFQKYFITGLTVGAVKE